MLLPLMENEEAFHRQLTVAILLISLPIFLVLQYGISSPWGKTLPESPIFSQWCLPARWAWFLFEVPNLYWCFIGYEPNSTLGTLFLALFAGHYVQRSIYYPLFRLSPSAKPVPVLVVLSAFLFTNCNGYLQARSLSFTSYQPPSIIKILIGFTLFCYGVFVNYQSDAILLELRRKTPRGQYSIPHGGLFRYVSAPHYLGECIEWTGFAILTGSFAALVFAVFTAANLVPRALAHHRWYQQTFKDYPRERRAILPGIL